MPPRAPLPAAAARRLALAALFLAFALALPVPLPGQSPPPLSAQGPSPVPAQSPSPLPAPSQVAQPSGSPAPMAALAALPNPSPSLQAAADAAQAALPTAAAGAGASAQAAATPPAQAATTPSAQALTAPPAQSATMPSAQAATTPPAQATTTPPAADSAPPQSGLFPDVFGRWFLAGQMNFVYQAHGGFPAAYSGPNSLIDMPEDALTRVITLYTAVAVNSSTELIFDPEETGGHGLSDALGLAGFTDLDAVRNPSLSKLPYIARLLVHHVIDLGGGREAQSPSPLGILPSLPRRRLDIYLGKFSLVDFFDVNSVGGDSHLQFLDWTIDNNGAYDYAANTRGYTVAALVQYESPAWGARFAEALMPTVANGNTLAWNLRRARSENAEVEWRPPLAPLRRHATTLRLLGYANTANMGIYRVAIDNYLAGRTATPEITAHPPQVTTKPGLGLNFESALSPDVHIYGRLGFADGRYESYAYTEVEQTVSAGFTAAGSSWHRSGDKFGLAAVVDGISGDHRRYLALGGQGFLLGDGALTYGHEWVTEGFYTLALAPGLYLSPDAQYIVNPGYNQVRGPVWVTTARLHVDF